MQTINQVEKKEKVKKIRVFRTPLAITGIILLVAALMLGGLALVLKAEPTHAFYLILCTALGFLAINPLLVHLRYHLLWQLIIMAAGITAIVWYFM